MPEEVTFRELVALALHGYYCIGDGATPGEPCLGRPEDIEGWTPVARMLRDLLTEHGFEIHRKGTCVHAPVPEGRDMTREEAIAVGLIVPAGTVRGAKIDSVIVDELKTTTIENEFVFGDS